MRRARLAASAAILAIVAALAIPASASAADKAGADLATHGSYCLAAGMAETPTRIRIHTIDADTGQPISGGARYEVTAGPVVDEEHGSETPMPIAWRPCRDQASTTLEDAVTAAAEAVIAQVTANDPLAASLGERTQRVTEAESALAGLRLGLAGYDAEVASLETEQAELDALRPDLTEEQAEHYVYIMGRLQAMREVVAEWQDRIDAAEAELMPLREAQAEAQARADELRAEGERLWDAYTDAWDALDAHNRSDPAISQQVVESVDGLAETETAGLCPVIRGRWSIGLVELQAAPGYEPMTTSFNANFSAHLDHWAEPVTVDAAWSSDPDVVTEMSLYSLVGDETVVDITLARHRIWTSEPDEEPDLVGTPVTGMSDQVIEATPAPAPSEPAPRAERIAETGGSTEPWVWWVGASMTGVGLALVIGSTVLMMRRRRREEQDG